VCVKVLGSLVWFCLGWDTKLGRFQLYRVEEHPSGRVLRASLYVSGWDNIVRQLVAFTGYPRSVWEGVFEDIGEGGLGDIRAECYAVMLETKGIKVVVADRV